MVGERPLRPQQIIDIVSGAIDAWFSRDVRQMTRASTTEGVVTMNRTLSTVCHGGSLRMTKRDGAIGAAVMIGATLLFAAFGILARRSGMPATSEFLLGLSFPASMMISMPFTFMKGQPWKAQAVVCGGTLAMLIVITYLAVLI